MPSILVATGFVRIDSDTKPALKALQAFGSLAASALSTSLVPAAAAATAAIGGIASAAAVAGGAVSAYGIAVNQQFKQITEASQKQTAAEDAKTKATVNQALAQQIAKKYGFEYGKQVEITADMTDSAKQAAQEYNSALSTAQSSAKAAAQSQEAYKLKLKDMPPATRDTAQALDNLKDTTKNWSDSLASSTMPVFTKGLEFLTRLIPKLTPIVKDVAAEVDDFVSTLGEGAAGKVFREFGQNVKDNGAGALRTFLDVGKNLIVGIGGILNAFMPFSEQMTGGLENLTEKFANWGANLGESSGFQKFITLARDAGPKVAEALGAIARAALDVASAAGPMSGLGLTMLTVFAQIVEAIPTPVLQMLVPTILAVNAAFKVYALYQSAAAAATWLFSTANGQSNIQLAYQNTLLAILWVRLKLISIWQKIVAASTLLWTLATTTQGQQLALQIIMLGVHKVAMAASAVATGIMTAATWALNAAIAVLTSPITLVIVALAALVAAIVWVATKTTWFQTAWKATWDFLKAIGSWFAGPFVNFFKSGWELIYRYAVQPVVHFFTQTIPDAARSLRERVTAAWDAMGRGLRAAWDFIYKWVIAGNIRFFTQTIPSAARTLRDKVVGFWDGMRSGVSGAYTWMRDKIFSPIGTFFTQKIPGWARTMRDNVKGFFSDMKDGIGKLWGEIKEKTKSPINWVIDHVWNHGIVSIWKKITGWIGLGDKLKEIKLLASGGTVGNKPLGIFNQPTAIVGEGNSAYPEYVIPTDPKYATRARGLWQAAGAHFMEDGGVVGWIKDKASDIGGAIVGGVKGIADFLTDPVGKAKKMLLSALGGAEKLGSSPWVKMAMRFPRMAVDGLIDLVKDAAGSVLGAVGLGSGNGGSGVQRWKGVVQMLLRTLGQPAAYTDLTLRRMNQESGGNPNIVNKWDSNWQAGHPSVGLMQVIRGTFQAYAGRYKNTGPFLYGVSVNPAANVYASMRYALSRYGSLPAAYNRPGGYANGTDGTTSGWHLFGERGPEIGYSPAGWRILNARRTASLAGGGNLVIERLVLENHGVIGSQHEVENWLVESLTTLKRKGRTP